MNQMQTPSTFPREKVPPTVWTMIETEARKREADGDKVIALHIGDTYIPFPDALVQPVEGEDKLFGSMLNRYSDTFGEAPLRELILQKVQQRNQIPVGGIDSVQMTSGATSALHAGFARLLPTGSEVLVPSPYWSILRNVADTAGVKLIEAPFFDALLEDGAFDPSALLERYRTDNTSALYLNTPSNPTGMLLDREMQSNIADFVRKHDLWVFSDEAYEDYIWDGGEHVSFASLPGMFEHTVSIYTFSKCFGASGIRSGYAVAPPSVISQLNRGVVGAYYQPGRLGQRYAWRGMKRFDEVLRTFRNKYAPVQKWVVDNLHVPTMPCHGTFYFFVDLGEGWKGIPPEKKIERMLEAGVVLSPGEYFGSAYDGWARLCFTVVPPDELRDGVDRLNRLLG